MKTRFSSLLRLKKRQLEEAEKRLVKARAERRAILLEIERLKREMQEIELPKMGRAGEMGAVFSLRQSLQQKIEEKEHTLERLKQQIQQLQEAYHNANLEYEKMKHLDEMEIEKLLEALKSKEAKIMDEIALQLAMRKKREPQS
ncbi:MAG: hypothetical protein B6D59_05610 [Campylobacteraceae bacterium 4484_4]|nr:MAG: hypothetical protein B6D59_05610 [Campylobacteraceae bacterium 4484_4]